MFCLADVSCIAKRCLFVVYILLFEGGLEGVERIGAFEECAADDMVGGRQRDGEFVFLRIEFGVLDVREPERLVGYGAFFHHGNRDQVAVDGDFPALSDVQRTFEAPEYETTVGIDLTKLDAAQIAAQIAQAKTMLPEGHSFKSVGSYQIEEDVPAGNSVFNRNKTFGKQHTSFVVRFTEDGKETESSAGKTSYIYYEAEVTVEPDGTLSIEEN